MWGHKVQNESSRVLIVEDEVIIALMLGDMLAQLSIRVSGPALNLEDASRLLQTEAFDAALLDANLAGKSSLPFAAELIARNIPFAFTTGYGHSATQHFPGVPTVRKPYIQAQITDILRKLGVRV